MCYMVMKKQLLSLIYGNKRAFILTLDALLAVIIVLIAIGVANSYIARSENVMPNIQTTRIGSDIIRLLENTNSFGTLDAAAIKIDMNSILPPTYGMRLSISWADANLEQTGSFEIGDELPDKKSVSTGKRFFVITNESSLAHYGLAKYWIWLK